jgi:hypothetical protein
MRWQRSLLLLLLPPLQLLLKVERNTGIVWSFVADGRHDVRATAAIRLLLSTQQTRGAGRGNAGGGWSDAVLSVAHHATYAL